MSNQIVNNPIREKESLTFEFQGLQSKLVDGGHLTEKQVSFIVFGMLNVDIPPIKRVEILREVAKNFGIK